MQASTTSDTTPGACETMVRRLYGEGVNWDDPGAADGALGGAHKT
jgi:hypothetical protein